jgi:hypothetical protein
LGSIAPLGIGLAMLSLVTVLVILSAGSLFLTERRLTTVAESTALSVIARSQGQLNSALNIYAAEFLSQHPLTGLSKVELIEAVSPEGKTVRVRICSIWQPLFISYIFSETGRVCSEGLARVGR